MKVLIADDLPEMREILRRYLERKGCEVFEAVNGREGLDLAAVHMPDLIVADIMMPGMDGFGFLKKLKENDELKTVPFVFLSGVYREEEVKKLAFSMGADAFITKPKSPDEFWKIISDVLAKRVLAGEALAAPEYFISEEMYLKEYGRVVFHKLEEKISELENEIARRRKVEEELKRSEESYKEISGNLSASLNEVKQREEKLMRNRDAFLNMLEDASESYKDLQELFMKLIGVMINALEAKSPWTKGHSMRVAMYAEEIAKEMGLDEAEIKDIRLAGLLHDIGKIGTYDYLLDKPSKLTDEEFAIVKKHPAQGAEILEGIKQLKDVLPIVRHHHERIDGRGYPDGLKSEEIPAGARIMHVADSFDSMTADRPYRPAPGKGYAISELKKYSGAQFDPAAVKAFFTILGVNEDFADTERVPAQS
jgi:putative nucleotidyltransferase with HDIG domain